jgi:uncharacterized protein (TIGR02569 family)
MKMMTVSSEAVPAVVLEAFGLTGRGHRLPGGQGQSFRYGRAVLKPTDDPVMAAWSAQVLARIEPAGFRLPRPLRTQDGRSVVDGWSADEYVQGHPYPAGGWEGLLAAGRALHAALAHVPRPALLDERQDRWAVADRAAWGEQAVTVAREASEHWARLTRLREPLRIPSQLIHGDLSGNVLFDQHNPPAIIDFSPYWRPPAYADAILAVDAALWHHAVDQLMTSAGHGRDFLQLLVRAALFRLVALTEKARDLDPSCLSDLALFTPVIRTVERLATRNTPA